MTIRDLLDADLTPVFEIGKGIIYGYTIVGVFTLIFMGIIFWRVLRKTR